VSDRDGEDIKKYITKVEASPFLSGGDKQFITGYSDVTKGGHVLVFGDPKDPFDRVEVVVDPTNDPITPLVVDPKTDVKLKVEGDAFTLHLDNSSSGTTTPQKSEGSRRTDGGGSSSGGGGSISFSPASVSSSVVTSLAPSLKTLGENQQVILTDVRTGFGQTYENQQQIYNKLKAQEQMLAKVAAGVAGLTAATYAIQQEINTLVILFGAAFLVIVAALGFLIWKQMQMEKRMMYLLMRWR